MATYVKTMQHDNNGPLRHTRIDCGFKGDGNPKPLFLVGKNGSGKSIALSNIVDALFEIGAAAYTDAVQRTDSVSHRYFRSLDNNQISPEHDFLCAYVSFAPNEEYVFKTGQVSFDNYRIANPNASVRVQWKDASGHFKHQTMGAERAKKLFDSQVVCYFEPNRYERPAWLVDEYFDNYNLPSFSSEGRGSDSIRNPIIPSECALRNQIWLMDIIADSRCDVDLSVEDSNKLVTAYNTNVKEKLFLRQARKNIEKMLSAIVERPVYLDLRYRNYGASRLRVVSADSNTTYAPSLNSLSTGQLALFDIFATIIRYGDSLNPMLGTAIEDIEGIVVVDEIELHLHTHLQHDVLPKLICMFPKVQFIIATHSPLLLLGMKAEVGSEAFDIIELPEGRTVLTEEYSEFGSALQVLKNTSAFVALLEQESAEVSSKALVVTEGTTDWRHLQAAYSSLEKSGHTDELPTKTQFELYRFGPKKDKYCTNIAEMGDAVLANTCRRIAQLPHQRPIIFIADSDNDKVTKDLRGDPFKAWGNNVYSFVLPTPDFRTGGISIELLYPDEVIKQLVKCKDGVERRLYLSSEFDECGRSTDGTLFCDDKNKCKESALCIIDEKVYPNSFADKTNMALSKVAFANAILDDKVEGKFDAFVPVFAVMKKLLDSIAISRNT